jgi:hypothetical protein
VSGRKRVVRLLCDVLEENAVSTRSRDDPTSRPRRVSERRKREGRGATHVSVTI